MTNKIVILENSVELYEHFISDERWERTLAFPRGGVTYLVSNSTIKFFAYEDYLYRNCIMSMQLPVYVVDEKRDIDGEYSDTEELGRVLDPIFPSNDVSAELEFYLTVSDAEKTYQPIGDYALKDEIPSLDGYVTDEELLDVLSDYYTKDESDSKFQPNGDYVTEEDFSEYSGRTEEEISRKLDASAYTPCDLSDYYTRRETDSKFQVRLVPGDNITISGNVISAAGGGVEVDAYTKQESDSRYQPKGNYVTESQVVNNYYTTANTYNRTEIDQFISILEGRIGALEDALEECCSSPSASYRWVTMTGVDDYICDGLNEYAKQKRQVSTDGGNTWSDCQPAEYRKGGLIAEDSEKCGYAPSGQLSGDYLTFQAIDEGTFTFEGRGSNDSIQYSLDSGSTWATLQSYTPTPVIAAGKKVMWKGEMSIARSVTGDGDGIGTFTSTGRFSLGGNAMSLLFGDGFKGAVSLEGRATAFTRLFNGCSMLVNAEALSLPATTLSEECYDHMFQGCQGLVKVPARLLPATALADYCYHRMFRGCTSLATTIGLPATTLAKSCYGGMFQGCSSLREAPVLGASVLTEYCYAEMFNACSSLSYIKCLATDISAPGCTSLWVTGVAGDGTFVKASGTNWHVCNTSAHDGIPCGWTVETA